MPGRSDGKWHQVTAQGRCPACGRPDWCAWTQDGWLKCERETVPPAGMKRVKFMDGGALFMPTGEPVTDTTPKFQARREVLSVSVSRKPPKKYDPFPSAQAAASVLAKKWGTPAGQWTYLDRDGQPLMVMSRFPVPPDPEKPNGKPRKTFRPVSRVKGGWVIGDPPGKLPLYGIPDLVAAQFGSRVYIVEGERKADALRAMGLLATTSAHGARSADKTDWSPLAGRDIVILPDNDKDGDRYVQDLIDLLSAAGAKSIRVAKLAKLWAGMPKGGDIMDLLSNRGGDADAVRDEVEALAAQAEPVEPEKPNPPLRYQRFPVHLLPEPVRSFVISAAKSMGCDPAFIAIPLLGALAGAIGSTYRIELKPGWTEPSILWLAVVAKSGTMKTPGFKVGMQIIRTTQKKAFKKFAEDLVDWEAEDLRYTALANAWKKKVTDGQVDAGDAPERPVKPTATRYIVSDTTVEALAPILQANPRGVVLGRDELNGWLASFDRYAKGGKSGGGDSSHWLSMHNGEEMLVDRKGGGTIYVPLACVSIVGGIQPGILARAMGQDHLENGMVARILFAMPPFQSKKWNDDCVDPVLGQQLSEVFGRLLSLEATPDPETDSLIPHVLGISPQAKEAWVPFYETHSGEQADLADDLSAAWSKLEGYAARLALVLHLIRWAGGKSNKADIGAVDEESMKAGIELSRWFGHEARRLYPILTGTEEDRSARRLSEVIEKLGGAVKARDLMRKGPCFKTAELAEAALEGLVQRGWGYWDVVPPGESGGPALRLFRLHGTKPLVTDTDTTPENQLENGSSVSNTTLAKPPKNWGKA